MRCFSRKVKIGLMLAAGLLILVIILQGSYYGRAVWIKTLGVQVRPTQIYQPQKVEYFLQNDPEWKENLMGNSGNTLGGYGCLVSSLASSIDYMGYTTTPGNLNDLFSEKSVYTGGGEVIWYKINEVIPRINYSYKRVFNAPVLEEDLRYGRLPIVKVRYHKTGVFHWVLIVGTDNEDFLIMDPLNPDKKPISLRTHGRVYAYRVLTNLN